MNPRASTHHGRKTRDVTPIAEWMAGLLGAGLFLAGLSFLVAEGLQGEDRPGAIAAYVSEILPAGDGYLVRYKAHNRGSRTVADLHVSARLYDGAEEIDRSDAVLDYVPGDSTREGGFYLREDPQRYRLEIRPEGYQEP